MTSEDPQDLLRQHKYPLTLDGREGDVFRISWRSSVPVDLDVDEGAGTRYLSGLDLRDLSKSLEVTLNESRAHLLVFSQYGRSIPESRGNSQSLLPAIEPGTPRAFIPFTIKVEKLN